VIPAIGSLVIAMIKNSAVVGVSLLALPDLLKEARIVQSRTFQTTETFFWAGVGYLILTAIATLVFRYLERRLAIRR
jgi:ABC-type amino acid transport system permease subunit